MAGKQEITASLNEAWGRLNTGWTGEHANAFHRQYVTKMTETTEAFESACSDLSDGAAELSKKLEMIEQGVDSK